MSWECKNCGEQNDEEIHGSCWKCKQRRYPAGEGEFLSGVETPFLCSTTPQIPGREIASSKGIVFGEAILGTNIFRDVLAGARDIVGGRSGAYESKLKEGRKIAVSEMLLDAQSMEADAVVGISIDYETVGASMLMICASGTAVVLKS